MQSGWPDAASCYSREGEILAGSRIFQRQGLCGELTRPGKGHAMWAVVFLLVGFWGLGLAKGYSFGGLMHILLVYAGLMVTARLLERRRRRTGQSTVGYESM